MISDQGMLSMFGFWEALTTALVVLVVFNLLVTVSLVRRVSLLLGNQQLQGAGLPVGVLAPDVDGLDPDGEEVRYEAAADHPALIGIFSTHCSGCKEQRPEFARQAEELTGRRVRVAAVIVGDLDLAREFGMTLPTGVQRIHVAAGSPFVKDYGVRLFPYYLALERDGSVSTSTASLAQAAEMALAAADGGGDRV